MAYRAGPPNKYGVIVFTGFQALDVFGPLSTLNVLSRDHHMELAILAETLDPVTTNPEPNPFKSSSFGQKIVPTHIFADRPEVEVLIIPGGFGTRNAKNMAPVESYIRSVFPHLKYVITVCTGSAILANMGLLDNRRATSNKSNWNSVIPLGPKVNWIGKARWVFDDTAGLVPIWSSSGVSAGIDVTFAFIKMLYGAEVAKKIADVMEYDRHLDDKWDPFADVWGVSEKSS